MSDMEQKYECPNCGWVGIEDEMEADCDVFDEEELWSNWICPNCHEWYRLGEYKKVPMEDNQ